MLLKNCDSKVVYGVVSSMQKIWVQILPFHLLQGKKNLNCHYKIDYICEVRFKPTVRKKS